ncbi:MAG: hypothetical protein DSZ23_03665 [Thermodesulfatator sp.]|nr:MAG: hypothetical protein DSZ23_03665 [Thermodesulfatator sp.]
MLRRPDIIRIIIPVVLSIFFVIMGLDVCRGDDNATISLNNWPVVSEWVRELSLVPADPLHSLPAAFDLRTEHRALPAAHDHPCASCWASAGTYMVESLLMPGQETDLSETDMQMTMNEECSGGGSLSTITNYLTTWNGPVTEDDYQDLVVAQGKKAPIQAHVQQVRILPARRSPNDNLWIKSAIYHYGPVYAEVSKYGIGHDNPNCPNCYYMPKRSPQHAVALVGWDDNIPREWFSHTFYDEEYTPPGDGAFIARGNEGFCYYISYYDGTVGYDITGFLSMESTDNYRRIYQHDPLGTLSWLELLDIPGGYEVPNQLPTVYGGNVFIAQEDEILSAVGFKVEDHLTVSEHPDTTVHVSVYLDPDSGPVNTSGPVSSFTTVVYMDGYYTVPLPQEIPLSAGQRFSVVLHYGTNLPIETKTLTHHFAVSPGESFISKDGTQWFDITDVPKSGDVFGNLDIKAYTRKLVLPAFVSNLSWSTDWDFVSHLSLMPWHPGFTLGKAPEVESTEPLNNETVTDGVVLKVHFKDQIKPGPGLADVVLASDDETRLVFVFIEGDTLLIPPGGPLTAHETGGKKWTVKIPADAVTDIYGNSMEQDYSWSFVVMAVN